jgi:site-specific recombinase XerD
MTIIAAHEAFCQYLVLLRNQSPKTVKGHQNSLSSLRSFAPHLEQLTEVSDSLVERFFFWGRTKREWRASTFHTHHKHLNVFFAWAMKKGHANSNPFLAVEKPRLEQRVPKRLSRDDSMRLIEAAACIPWGSTFRARRNTAMIAVFIYAGLRRGELLDLSLEDVDLRNQVLFIRQAKGAKDRLVPIPDRLLHTLESYAELRRGWAGSSSHFFVSAVKDCGFTYAGLKRVRNRIVKETGVYFYFHQLRHTYATLMLEGGCDIYSLAKMMGHNDIRTTTIYLSASVEHLRRESAKHPLNNWQDANTFRKELETTPSLFTRGGHRYAAVRGEPRTRVLKRHIIPTSAHRPDPEDMSENSAVAVRQRICESNGRARPRQVGRGQ